MNWSTRLRRWVRIRMPPVREASMKPTAATVLPAPVACSNQKRRLAPGSSGASATTSGPRSRPRPSPGAPRRDRARRSPRRARRPRCRCRFAPSPFVPPLALPAVAAVLTGPGSSVLELGDDRRQRPRERVDLVLVELGAVEQRRASPRRAGARGRASASSRRATRCSAPRLRHRARRARRRPRAAGRCPGRGRRSSRRRAGSAHGRTPAPDRGRPHSARQPRSRLRRWY